MAQVQKYFKRFHNNIKLKRFKRNATLREKRDIILAKLRSELPGVFERHGEEMPEYETKDLGSYAMGTGNKPVKEDFDIDQGLYFHIPKDDYGPVVLKERVHEALDGHTHRVEIRRSCVTVWYKQSGESVYHVDIAVFADGGWSGKPHIAKGKANSADRYRRWERSDPVGLIEKILSRFEGRDRAQFRRIVRYMKRWKDENFPSGGNAAPVSVALTVAAYHWLDPKYTDLADGSPDDLSALIGLVKSMLQNVQYCYHEWEWVDRIVVQLPVEPQNDLFENMTNRQQDKLIKRLEILLDGLLSAKSGLDPHTACSILSKIFGHDFPVPSKKEVAKKQRKPYASSSAAA
jgi:hypothetical protein